MTPDEITSRQRKRIYNSLQQTHLPKLERTGFVTYNSARGSAKLTEQASNSICISKSFRDGNCRGRSTISDSAASALP
ncbi:DUF7344 domain-containing protein [Haladaptatus litoreus]